MPQLSIPLEVLEDLDIIDSSPDVVYLLEWAAKQLDMTKVSSQTDLTRWLQETIQKETKRLKIDEREYRKRFKGMIKFFTQPDLGLKTVEEIQNKIAEGIVEDLEETYKTIRDYEDVISTVSEYKGVELPPLASQQLKNTFNSIMDRLYSIRSRVRSHKDYPDLLIQIKSFNQLIKSGRYKKLPRRILVRYYHRARSLLDTAKKIQEDLNLKFTIFRPTITRIIDALREEIIRRVVR